MGPTSVPSAPGGPHVGSMNLAIRGVVFPKVTELFRRAVSQWLFVSLVDIFAPKVTYCMHYAILGNGSRQNTSCTSAFKCYWLYCRFSWLVFKQIISRASKIWQGLRNIIDIFFCMGLDSFGAINGYYFDCSMALCHPSDTQSVILTINHMNTIYMGFLFVMADLPLLPFHKRWIAMISEDSYDVKNITQTEQQLLNAALSPYLFHRADFIVYFYSGISENLGPFICSTVQICVE